MLTFVPRPIFKYLLHFLDDSDDNEYETTPLIKPTSDPDISKTPMTTNRNSMEWLQHKAVNYFKAFCIPGVIVVSCINMLLMCC